MHVSLISYTPEPEKTVAAAAKLCYSPVGAEELMDNLGEAEVSGFLAHLVEVGHLSPLEHATFTFAVEGVSRVLSHQMVRHRIASYSQKSQRYVSEAHFSYVVPPSIAARPEALRLFEEKMQALAGAYRELAAYVPKEDARYLLPNACETKFVCSFNARSLLNFFRLRLCQRAQWEIRRLAELMRQEVSAVAPNLFRLAGPPCEVEGICYEGDKSCGRVKTRGKRKPVG